MLMVERPGTAIWRTGLAGAPLVLPAHPVNAALSRSTSASSLGSSKLSRHPSQPDSLRIPSRPYTRRGLFTSASQASLGSFTGAGVQHKLVSASSLSPSCHVAGHGLASSRGPTDYMPFALAQDAAFFQEIVRSERRGRAQSAAAARRQFGQTTASTQAAVQLATAFPAAAGAAAPPAALSVPVRRRLNDTGRPHTGSVFGR